MVKKSVKKKPTEIKKSIEKTKNAQKNERKNKINNNKSNINKINVGLNLLKKAIPVIFILFVMWFAFSVRSGPINLDGMDDRIESSVYSNIKAAITQQVNQKYPNLDEFNKQNEINKIYSQVIETGIYNYNSETINIKDLVNQQSQSVKDGFKDENGQTYLNAIDPYHYYRLGENYLENGHTGNTLNENGEPWVDYKLAPIGLAAKKDPSFHTWLESKLYAKNNIDENSTVGEKTKVIYLIPVIFVILSIIPIYLILRKYSNDLFALFGSLLLVSIGTFVSRTIAGFVDTDAYNVFFPLVIIAFLVYAFSYKNKLLTIFLAICAGLFQGLFLWAWGKAWFMFLFSIAALAGYLVYLIIINLIEKNSFKEFTFKVSNDLLTLTSFIISSYIFTWIFLKKDIFNLTFSAIFGTLTNIAGISQTKIWPNVLSSVAELNPASFGQIINGVGGKVVFLIAMIGLVFLTIDFKNKDKQTELYKKLLVIMSIIWFASIIFGNFLITLTANNAELFIILLFVPVAVGFILSLIDANTSNKLFLTMLLGIWMAGTIYMSLNGVRFILLLAPAFAIAFGMGLYYLGNIINHFLTVEFSIKNKIKQQAFGFITMTIVFLILFVPMANQAIAISNGTTPNFDDAWYSTMYKIKNESSQDAIITSWWDFGHFFTAIAERGVTFDGGSQTTPQSHWVGKLLMENDEDKAIDILRMLVCGGNEAHNTMLNIVNGSAKDAVKINKIIYETLGKDIVETRDIIETNKYYSFTPSEVDEIMNYLACENPREDFLITSEDMVGKAGVWAHWGSWDFTKKYVHDNYKTKSASEIALDIDENFSLIEQYILELNNIEIEAETKNIKRENLINQWFAPYPSYIPIQNKYSYTCQMSNNITLVCQNGISVDLSTGKIDSQFGEDVKFKNLVIPTQTGDLEIVPQDENGNIDVLLTPTAQGYEVMIMQTPLGASTFTKLFYLNGFGTEHFELFDSVQSMTGVKVLTWKVKWDLSEEGVVGNTDEEIQAILDDTFLGTENDSLINESLIES